MKNFPTRIVESSHDTISVGPWQKRPHGTDPPGYRYRIVEGPGIKLRQRDLKCHLCETRGFVDFMVRDDVWDASGCRGIVCLDCFEQKLGREVTLDDLIDAPINEKFFRGAEMSDP